MAEEANQKKTETSAAPAADASKKTIDVKAFIEGLFENGNYLCTLPGAKLPDGTTLNIND